ncbi:MULTISPECIES: GntR family transcriptional regulator [Kitasatospora]|uniref:Putative GntR family transcriptional regulator n=1 Tax=Kitasatospora setae (strain ATCC 33774 / DSM 43861 / JCM 3304 / KCC A-0304 / NBRC 14216 / KM-6054) TaxID=452652 RepID=E4NIY9_KITSK|nr:GntR family transcriptional regulator [Kitasatospora setae]BAJ32937.1 putative GntR family transcriptional regulator [Kitasatospora setae KM-6054]
MNHAAPRTPLAPARSGVPEHGRVPKYYLVKAELEELIGELGPGGRLPTEAGLAERYGVARATVRQALRDLLIEGRLRRQGRGTVVAGAKIEQPLSLASYTEGVTRQGLRPGRTLIALDRLPADPVAAERLAVPAGEPLWHLERVLRADEERVGLESTYLPVARVPDLAAEFDPAGSLYEHLRERGVRLARAEERIETVLATPREALLIGTPPALPMLLLHRRSRDADGHPLELVRTLYRGDRFSFTLDLTAPTTD